MDTRMVLRRLDSWWAGRPRLSRVRPRWYGLLYLAMIPLFAWMYATFMPDEFYDSAIQHETSAITKDTDRILRDMTTALRDYYTGSGSLLGSPQTFDIFCETPAHLFIWASPDDPHADFGPIPGATNLCVHSGMSTLSVDSVTVDTTSIDFSISYNPTPVDPNAPAWKNHFTGYPPIAPVGHDTFTLRLPVDDFAASACGPLNCILSDPSITTYSYVGLAISPLPFFTALTGVYWPITDHDIARYAPYYTDTFLSLAPQVPEEVRRYILAFQGSPAALSDFNWRMLYFSAVTIATVGYGDIVPTETPARIATGTEAIVGVLLIGLFLNALFQQRSKQPPTSSAPPVPPTVITSVSGAMITSQTILRPSALRPVVRQGAPSTKKESRLLCYVRRTLLWLTKALRLH